MQQTENPFVGLSVPRAIVKFAVPTVLSQMVTLLYNLADTFFVGHTNNPAQVAALTLSFPIFMLLTMVGNLFGIGANSFISRSLGRGEPEKAKLASTFALYAALAAVAVLIVVLLLFFDPILTAIGAVTPEVLAATKGYLTWTVVYGGLPTVATLMFGHLIRSEGNTRQASVGLAIGGLLNIALDPIFVQGLGMGAPGAGFATCISNVVALIYMLITVLRKKDNTVIVIHPGKLRIVPRIVGQVVLVGIPAATIIVLGTSANMVLTHCMSPYGEVSLAAYGLVQKIGTIGIQITVGLTQGIMPLLGYHFGAGNLERVKEINRWAFGILGVYAALILALIEIFARPLMLVFTAEESTVATGVEFIRIWIICAPGMCFTNLFSAVFQAMGKWVRALCLSVIRQGLLLIPLLLILNNAFGATGLILSQPISDTCALIVGILFYLLIVRQLKPAAPKPS